MRSSAEYFCDVLLYYEFLETNGSELILLLPLLFRNSLRPRQHEERGKWLARSDNFIIAEPHFTAQLAAHCGFGT